MKINLESVLEKLKKHEEQNENEINFMTIKNKINLDGLISLNEIDLENTQKKIKGFVVIQKKKNKTEIYEHTFSAFKKESILKFAGYKEKWERYKKEYACQCVKCEMTIEIQDKQKIL